MVYKCTVCGAVRDCCLVIPHSPSDTPILMPSELCYGEWKLFDRRIKERRKEDRRKGK